MIGLLGKKLGHTRVYDAEGQLVPVTVVLAGPNRVLQVKSQSGKDGYNAVEPGSARKRTPAWRSPSSGTSPSMAWKSSAPPTARR